MGGLFVGLAADAGMGGGDVGWVRLLFDDLISLAELHVGLSVNNLALYKSLIKIRVKTWLQERVSAYPVLAMLLICILRRELCTKLNRFLKLINMIKFSIRVDLPFFALL